METRIALIGIIVETPDSVESLNAILHDYSEFIIAEWAFPTNNVMCPSSVSLSMPPRM